MVAQPEVEVPDMLFQRCNSFHPGSPGPTIRRQNADGRLNFSQERTFANSLNVLLHAGDLQALLPSSAAAHLKAVPPSQL